jgi:acyl-[acyl carrier protein]--UDP-N-acetylglucosamine O-acyltransferase
MIRWCVLGGLCVGPTAATAATWVVDDSGGADFTSIQAAIDAAADGDRIEVRAGAYTEGSVWGSTYGAILRIEKSVTIVGAGADEVFVTSTTAPDNRTAAIVLAPGDYTATVEKLTLVNTRNGTDTSSPYGSHFSYVAIVDLTPGTGSLTLRNSVIRLPNNRSKAVFYKNNGNMHIDVVNSVIDLGDSGTVGMYGYANATPMNVELRNSILRNCNAAMNPGAHGAVHYTLIVPSSGSAPSGTGNLHGVNGAVLGFTNAAALDYTLQPSSSAINAGDPSPAFNDPDGSRNDMGLFGGPTAGACQPGFDEVTWNGADVCLHPTATVAPTATLGAGVSIGAAATIHPRAIVGAGATILDGASIGRRANVGAGASIGAGALIAAETVIAPDAEIGALALVGYGASVSGTVGAGATVGNLSTMSGTANLGPGARLGRSSQLATGVVVGDNANVGADVIVEASVSIGAAARVGRGSCVGAPVPPATRVPRNTDTCP